MKKGGRTIAITGVLIFQALILAAQGRPSDFNFGRDVYMEIAKTPPMARDRVWQDKLNRLAEGQGTVLSVVNEDRYHRGICVIVQDQAALRYGITIHYHLFLNNTEEAAKAVPGMTIRFTGQCAAYTRFDSSGRSWIIDIIYESGVISIE